MKARIKATGEIVTVRTWETYPMSPRVKCISFWQGGNYTEINGGENFEILPDEPEALTTSFDWESFRNETAAKLFVGIVSDPNVSLRKDDYNVRLVSIAVSIADELIKQRKSTL